MGEQTRNSASATGERARGGSRAVFASTVQAGGDPTRAFRETLLAEGANGLPDDAVDALRSLVDAGADSMYVDGQGNSHLHVLATVGNAEAIETYLRKSVVAPESMARAEPYVNAANARGDTALHIVASRPERVRHEIEELLAFGADPNATDADGATALMRRVRADDAGSVESLLEGGANANAEDRFGRTAMEFAASPTSEALRSLPGVGNHHGP